MKREIDVKNLPAPEKIRVLDAVFDAEKGLMVWGIETQDGDRYPMIYKRDEIQESFQLKYQPCDAEIVEFCQNMIGKEVTLYVIRDAKGKPSAI